MGYEGILLIDKPQSFTSFDVVAKLRGITRTKKIGHSGTLDPMATGVLPVFFGRATKAISLLPRDDKSYLAQIRLGIITDTQDITGTILEHNAVTVTKEDVFTTVKSFTGDILQIPPMYSALKIDGQKLCDLARKGIEVERQARPITIHSITCRQLETDLYELDVHCSKGTYIRTLAADIGDKLGCGATLFSLRRTMAAGFELMDCVTLEEVQRMEDLQSNLLLVESAFTALPKVWLTSTQERMFQNGVRLDASRVKSQEKGHVAVYGDNGFLGTAFLEDEELHMEKLFKLAGGE